MGKFEEAIIMYDRALQLDPNLAQAYLNKGIDSYVSIAIGLESLEQYDFAIRMLDIAL